MKSVISEKGQITIPKQFRDRHGFAPGVEIEFRSGDGELILYKVIPRDPLDKWRGKGRVKGFSSVDQYLTRTRGENSSR